MLYDVYQLQVAGAPARVERADDAANPPSLWLRSRGFDMTFFIGNAAIVPLVLFLVALNVSGDFLDAGVTALVGGPHIFATMSASAANRGFRARHPWAVPTAVLIPFVVIWLSVRHYPLLISLFLGAASFHVLHQCAYLSDLYRSRSPSGEKRWARFVDYGVIFTSMYPVALYKILHGHLRMGGAQVTAPAFLMNMVTIRLEWAMFAAFAFLWLAKCWSESRAGTLNRPKTLLIALTVTLSFVISGVTDDDHMGLAFQAMNAWHSMQYLGLVLLLRATRRSEEHGPISSNLSGLRGGRRFYLGNLAITLLLFCAIKTYARWNPFQLGDGQNYYIFVLSPLLVHYYLDAFGFFAPLRWTGQPSTEPVAAHAMP
jgi:hypothetical protein